MTAPTRPATALRAQATGPLAPPPAARS